MHGLGIKINEIYCMYPSFLELRPIHDFRSVYISKKRRPSIDRKVCPGCSNLIFSHKLVRGKIDRKPLSLPGHSMVSKCTISKCPACQSHPKIFVLALRKSEIWKPFNLQIWVSFAKETGMFHGREKKTLADVGLQRFRSQHRPVLVNSRDFGVGQIPNFSRHVSPIWEDFKEILPTQKPFSKPKIPPPGREDDYQLIPIISS